MPRRLSEEATRKQMIDPQLEKAGWYLADHSRVKLEIPVDGYDAEPWNAVTDYALYRGNGEVLPKRQSLTVWSASLRELQSATREELDALLPSVLDKEFNGET